MKKFLIYVSALSLLGSLPVSANDETEETWAVYWYLCGSDLESQYGCATEALSRKMSPLSLRPVAPRNGRMKPSIPLAWSAMSTRTRS